MHPQLDPSLIGADFGAVCQRFGAPRGCLHEHGALLLAYETLRGQVVLDAVQLVDGVVTALRADLRRAPASWGEQALLGQPVERALPQLGPPQSVEQLGDSLRFVYADCEVTVHEGVVACIVPLPPFTASA